MSLENKFRKVITNNPVRCFITKATENLLIAKYNDIASWCMAEVLITEQIDSTPLLIPPIGYAVIVDGKVIRGLILSTKEDFHLKQDNLISTAQILSTGVTLLVFKGAKSVIYKGALKIKSKIIGKRLAERLI